MNGKLSWSIFWALVGVFIVVISLLLIPALRNLLKGPSLFLSPFAVFSLLGVALIVFTVKEKVGGMPKKFLLLTGASSAGFLVFVLLHNAVFALFTYFLVRASGTELVWETSLSSSSWQLLYAQSLFWLEL